jgi:pimeloyl-ACP methyl ester carboxylesterase
MKDWQLRKDNESMNDTAFVFLPGTLCNERVFQYQTSIFKKNVVVDLRHSPTIESMIEAVSSVSLDKFVLVGFSMGGHIAQEFALKFPQRVEKLIVIAASSWGYPAEEKKLVQGSLNLIEQGSFHGISEKRLKEYLHPVSFENLEIRQLIHEMAGTDAKEVYLRQIRATLERRTLIAEMEQLNLPVLFLGGANDQIVPIASIQSSAENMRAATFVSVDRCGHFVPLEQPAVANAKILEFVAS